MADDVIRYGIIGTGMMGCEHIRNLALVPGTKITAIADPEARSRGWARLALGAGADGVREYADFRELLKSAPVDAVVVASPNFTHADVLDAVFATPKHVLVEKPLCTDRRGLPARGRAGGAPSRRRVGRHGVSLHASGRAPRRGGARRAPSGRLRMLAIREHRFPFLKKVGDWNRFARNTGGTLVEKCCHFFDLMNLIIGASVRCGSTPRAPWT